MREVMVMAREISCQYPNQFPVDIYQIVKDYGIIVDYISIGDEFNGLYLRYPSPTIAINNRQTLVRQRFTLAHELFHHLTCTNVVNALRFSTSREKTCEERKAKLFAAHLLMPEQAIRSLMALGLDKGKLLQAFLVSQEALDIRLRELRIA